MNKFVKIVLFCVAGLLIVVIAILGITQIASERVEVVELHVADASGEMVTTRLWMVDDDGFQYLRTGADGSGWYSRIEASSSIELTRNGETRRYTTEDRPEKSELRNQLMREKYTWGDQVVGVVAGSREGAIPVELHPMN